MRVGGATIVRNACLLHYPVVAAIESVLPLVDTMVVNVGRSHDDTAEMLRRELQSDKVRLLEREWPDLVRGEALAIETQAALEAEPADWHVYVQADEVLHQDGVANIREAMAMYVNDDRVEGLTVRFVHHYGSPDTVATARTWYRREVRVVKLQTGVRSFHEAQGFRVGGDQRRVRAKAVDATYHHYGWSRPVEGLNAKSQLDWDLYRRKRPRTIESLPWEWGLRRFEGSHPDAVRPWLQSVESRTPPINGPRPSLRQVRLAASATLERVTGRRFWEYRNYTDV